MTLSSVTSRGCYFPDDTMTDTGVDYEITGTVPSKFKMKILCFLYSFEILEIPYQRNEILGKGD